MSLLGKKPLQFRCKIGSEGRVLVFWFIASIVCLESKVQRKGKSNKNASYQTAIDFAHSAILGMEGEKRGSFHKYPNHSISSFCKSVWKKGKKKSFRASPPCVITTVCPVKTSKEFSVRSSLFNSLDCFPISKESQEKLSEF